MAKTSTMRDKEPLVSIVILNWNGNEDTVKCVESVNHLIYKNVEIIVIDNGSMKPIVKSDLKSQFPLKVIKNEVNRGFAGGEVSALPYCTGEYIFLLNNDALIDKDAVSNALKVFKSDEKIAVVGGKSYSLLEDGNTSLGFYSFQYIDPVTADVKTYDRDDGLGDTVTVSGAAVMIKRSVIDTYGYFDERFFAYYEETDLFARYQRAGLRVVYDPSVIILHKDGASTKDKRFMYYYLMLKNQFLFAYKNFSKESRKDFLETYSRNFRRSLWIYLKDRSKAEGIHKARVRSTLWNMAHLLGTIQSRRETLAINPTFNYSRYLYTKQPLDISLVIDATGEIAQTRLTDILQQLLALDSRPAEIIIVTDKPFDLPAHSELITVKNIVDKKLSEVSAVDFGFMTSNNSTFIATTIDKISSILSGSILSSQLVSIYEAVVRDEAAVVVQAFSGSDINIANGRSSELFAIRKSDLVDFLFMNKSIYSINEDSLGQFINWVVMECKPIARLESTSERLTTTVRTPDSTYSILNNPLKWRIKKSIRKLHLSRVLNKVKKIIRNRLDGSSINEQPIVVENLPLDVVPSNQAMLETPIFLNTRDLYKPLAELLRWLDGIGYRNIIFVDNDSTYPELIELFARTKYQVIPLGRNGMHRSPWESFAVRFFAKDKPYIVSDPDITPTAENPKDTIAYLYKVLRKFPQYKKVGVALKIDDIPDYYSMKQHVLEWESRYWDKSLLVDHDIYAADVDTTFALYREKTEWCLSPSLRVGGIHAMHHAPWYQNLNKPSNDMMYYRARASNEVSTWVKGNLPKHHLRALKKEGILKK